MARIDTNGAAVQLTLEGAAQVLIVQSSKDARPKPNQMEFDPFETPVVDTETIGRLVERFRTTRDWSGMIEGGDLNGIAQHIRDLSDDQFRLFPDHLDRVLREVPTEGPTMGSVPLFIKTFGTRMKQFAMEIRTQPQAPRKIAS